MTEYYLNDTTSKFSNNSADIITAAAATTKVVPVVNQPFQALLLVLILVSAIITNGSVILNISRDSLKLRMVHFLLIRHVCITDSVGAIFVLPVPLISFIKGAWIWGDTACSVISTTTACCWTMHLVAVALYRADRVFAVWLPTGKYPVVSARVVNGLLVLIWATALTGSYVATITFTPTFQPALALCIPNVPLVFFILVFASYILGLIILTTGYVFAFVTKRRKRKKRKRAQQQEQEQQQHVSNLPSSHQCNSKSAPQLNTTTTSSPSSPPPSPQQQQQPSSADCCNNNKSTTPGNYKQVMFQSNSSVMITSSTSDHSCNNSSSNNNNLNHPRASTPPPPAHTTFQQTHRRSHSDNVRISQIVISNESVASVQYRTLSHGTATAPADNDSSDEYTTGVDESVAEKLDECEEERSSSIADNKDIHHHHVVYDVARTTTTTTAAANAISFTPPTRRSSAKCRVFASYAVSIGHLILYLPAMLVVGLLGGQLPPGVAFLCGTVVYCEFIVQPIALLLVSPKLRGEVVAMVKSILRCKRSRDNTTNTSNHNNNNNNDTTTNQDT